MPFSAEDFLRLFGQYNEQVWPVQFLLYLLAILVVGLLLLKKENSGKIINAVLALFWLWMGVVYHLFYFSSINPAAFIFGPVFILQGMIFLWFGVYKNKLEYIFRGGIKEYVGLLFVIFALLFYPYFSYGQGHIFPETPTFGLPCPTVIFTFGILLFLKKKPRWYIYLVPFLWSLLGFSAALQLGIREDFSLVISGIVGTFFLIFGRFEKRPLMASV